MNYDESKPKATRGSRACTVCRRLKMKCVGAENGTPCKRCLSGNHQCLFEESNRGKRAQSQRKHELLSRSIKNLENTLDSVIRSMNIPPYSPPPSPSIHPSPKLHSLPDNSLNPLGLLAEASLANSNNLSSSNHVSSVGVAARNYFKPGPMTILPLRRLYIERQIQPEMLNFVSKEQVVDLFNIYFENLNSHAYLLDPNFHSPSLVCSRSPFLLTTICALASKFYTSQPDLHPRLTDLAKSLAFSVPEKGYKSVEIVQAYLLLSLWGCGAVERFERDKTWMLLGMAIRMATDLNLNRKASLLTADMQDGKAPNIELHNRERTWIICFVLDRSFSLQMGKPYTIREDYIIRHVKEFYTSSIASEMDAATSAYVQLQQIISRSLDFLYSGTDSPSGLQTKCDYMQVVKSFESQLGAWWVDWGETHTWTASYVQIAADFYYNYALLVLNSFGLQNALESLSPQSPSRPSKSSVNRINISYFFSKVYNAAHRCAILVRDRLGPGGHLTFLPDSHYVQMSYAVLSLLKLIRPELQPYIASEKEIIHVVKDVAAALADAAVDELHTPALYGNFLRAIVDAKVGGGVPASGGAKRNGNAGGGTTAGGDASGEQQQVEGGMQRSSSSSGSGAGAGGGGGAGCVDAEMSPSSSGGGGGSAGYRTSPASFVNSPQSAHSHSPSTHRSSPSSSSSLSHRHGVSGQPQLGGPSSLSILSLADYPYPNTTTTGGEMGPAPMGVDMPAFPGALPAAVASSGTMAPAAFASSSGLLSAGGELGEGVPAAMMGCGGLTMEDVLGSVFWDSMVVPGFNTLDIGFGGGFVFGGSGLVTPRQVPGTPH